MKKTVKAKVRKTVKSAKQLTVAELKAIVAARPVGSGPRGGGGVLF